MSVYRFRIGRWEIFSWEVEHDSADVLAQAIADLTDDEGITGGGVHDFERDLQPPDPMREEPWEDRRRLGFQLKQSKHGGLDAVT